MLGAQLALAFPPRRGFKLADPEDPDHPGVDEHTYRILLTDDPNGLCAIVDAIDYWWACQWRWHNHPSNPNGNRVVKNYARRAPRGSRDSNEGGAPTQIYLHKAILIRMGAPQPTEYHTIGDHQDGDSLNCRRYNLEWNTLSGNAQTAKRKKR
jgi:hypothetical protein